VVECLSKLWAVVSAANLADWIGALSNAAIAGIAWRGYVLWRRPALAQRDHDVAMRLLAGIAKTHLALDEVRTDGPLVTDEAPPAVMTGGESDESYKHRMIQARFRYRLRHLAEAAEARTIAMLEMLATIDDAKAGAMVNELANLENRVKREAAKYVNNLDPRRHLFVANPADLDVLFAPDKSTTPDAFADEYENAKDRISERLGPVIRMKKTPKR
jgi:hypothetical protein